MLAELDQSGAAQVEYIWLGSRPVGVLEAGQLGYIHTDHLDTPRLITRPGGQALWRWESDPFGNTAADTNPGGLGAYGFNLRFAGQYFDAESGLHYNGARYYDPQSGRYTQSDPIGIAGGLNAYVYANNQPTMQTDATGQCPLCIAALVGGIIGGGLDLVGQLADHGGQWGCVDGGQVAKSALTGAALGVAGEAAVALMGNAALEAAAIDGAVAQAASVEAGMAAETAAIRRGPVNGPGPLGEKVASTFRGGSYTESALSAETTLYRSYGGTAGELGSYWTRTPPAGSLQATMDSALNPAWGNTAQSVSTIRIPAGTTIYEGFAAPQGGLLGGGSQVYNPKVNPKWLVHP